MQVLSAFLQVFRQRDAVGTNSVEPTAAILAVNNGTAERNIIQATWTGDTVNTKHQMLQRFNKLLSS